MQYFAACLSIFVAASTAIAQISPEEAMRRLRNAEATEQDVPKPKPTNSDQKLLTQLSDSDYYWTVPINGVIGVDVHPAWIAHVLEHVDSFPCRKHVVFTIDSGGGYVESAFAIQEAMAKYEGSIRFHAIITNAISAAIWIPLACDTITIADGGVMGGALTFRLSETGNIDVDAKMNSIIAAKLASRAAAKGHSVDVVRAMMLPEQELFYDESSKALTKKRNANTTEVVQRGQILTLTSDEAVKYGIADGTAADPESLRTILQIKSWHLANDWPRACRAPFMYLHQLKNLRFYNPRLGNLIFQIRSKANRAYDSDPRQFMKVESGSTTLWLVGKSLHTRKYVARQAVQCSRAWQKYDEGFRTSFEAVIKNKDIPTTDRDQRSIDHLFKLRRMNVSIIVPRELTEFLKSID